MKRILPLVRRRHVFNIFRIQYCIFTILAVGLIVVLNFEPAEAQSVGPRPGLKSLDARGQMQISDEDRCPVCAMKVNSHSKFASAILLADGKTFYFCGTGCMIRSWMHPDIFLKVSPKALRRSVVQDYFSGEQVDGLAVIWVAGSDVVGPMGPAFVPIKTEDQVDVFKKRHGGKATFRLSDMNDEKWQAITGKKAGK